MAGDIELWVLGQGSAEDVKLPDLGDYIITPIAGDVGSISVDYPRAGRRWSALHDVRTQDRPVEVEIRVNGTATGAIGGFLTTAAGDEIKPGAVWTFTGVTLEGILRRARTPHNTNTSQGGNDKGETALTGTAGVMVRTLMLRAHNRGALLSVDYSSFTNTHDSNGVPWASTASVVLAPGRDYADILATTLHAAELCEWEVVRRPDDGYSLRLYNAGTRGVDRTLPGSTQLTLEYGRDLEDAPVKHDATDLRSYITAAGKDGLVRTATNPTAQARIGDRVEGYVSFGDVADAGTLLAAAQLTASTAGDGLVEHSHALVLAGDRPFPGRDFGLSDWVLRGVGETPTRERVVRYTLSRQGPEVRAAVTLGGIIAARAVRVQRAIDALTNGATVVGAPSPPPDFDDGKAPAAPTGLTATSAAGTSTEGTGSAQITAQWLPVETNDDGSAIGDLDGYVVQYRYSGGDLPGGWVTAALVSGQSTVVSFDRLAVGRAVEVRVAARDRYDRQSEWSTVASLFTARNTTPPPVASTPAPYSHLGLLVVPWDGRGAAGESMPSNFLAVEVHISTAGPTFTPDRPMIGGPTGVVNLAASTTYAGELRGAGELPVDIGAAGYGTTFYVKLVGRNRDGFAAAASTAGSTVLQRVADGDIAELNIGKLRAGILTAIMTVTGKISTRTGVGGTGAGWEGDSAGFRFMNAANQAVLEFISATASLLVTGTVQTGRIGRRAVLSGAGNDLRFYPQNGETRFARIYSYVPSNYPNDVAVDVSASDADELDVVSRLSVLPHFAQLGVQDQDDNTRSWSRLFVNRTAARAELFSSPGDLSAALNLDTGLNELSTYRSNGDRSTWIYGFDPGETSGLNCLVRAGHTSDSQRGEMTVATSGYSFHGTVASDGRRWGTEYSGGAALLNLRTAGAVQVVNELINAWRPVRASAFEVQCSAEAKEGFEALPGAALDVLRLSPITRYHRLGDPDGERQVGPVAEDLPGWLLRARTGPATRMVSRDGPPREVVDEVTGQVRVEAGPDEMVEVPADLPDSDRIDVLSYAATIAQAVRELDAELDEFRRSRGRPVPARRSVADLLDRIRRDRAGAPARRED